MRYDINDKRYGNKIFENVDSLLSKTDKKISK